MVKEEEVASITFLMDKKKRVQYLRHKIMKSPFSSTK
jgi:hypothetical protein